jgi:hypothetical protein
VLWSLPVPSRFSAITIWATALLALCSFVALPMEAGLHAAAAVHVYCDEHGVVEHAANADGDESGPTGLRSATEDGLHQDCALDAICFAPLLAPARAQAADRLPAAVASAPRPPLLGPLTRTGPPLLRFAPKTSPPPSVPQA